MDANKPSGSLIKLNVVTIVSGFLLFGAIIFLDSRGVKINVSLVIGIFVILFVVSSIAAWLNARFLASYLRRKGAKHSDDI